MSDPLRLGTRGSRLALWQAHYVAERLRAAADARVELVVIQTYGDQAPEAPLTQVGGQGIFTKEIQRALLDRRVDLAVHSLKDLPTQPVAGLMLAAVPPRGPVGDVFVSLKHGRFDDLPQGARVATGSLRRRAQLLHRRPDLQLEEIRGNVETRVRKLREQELDALILAQAGLERLGLHEHMTEILDRSWMLPAVGQGALGLECRSDDAATQALVTPLNDRPTQAAVLAERAFLFHLGGGCQVPIAAHAQVEGETVALCGTVLRADGQQRLLGNDRGPIDECEAVGRRLAASLLDQGARTLLGSLG